MEHVVPWKSLRNLIEPFYLVAGRGRHPYPLDTLSRVRPMQNWFGLSEQYAPGIARIRPPMHSEPDR
jgi:IS5 family transposase